MKKSVKVLGFVVIFAFSLSAALLSSGELVSSAQATTELDGHTLPAEWNLFGVSSSGWSDCRLVYVSFADQSLPLGPVSSSYDREAAYNYAMQWWNSCNHDCTSGDYKSCTPWSYLGSECCGYTSHGGDCANFVSQCLIAGGHPYLKGGDCKYPDGTLCCRGYPCGKEEIGAKRLGDCLVSKGWKRTCGYHASPPSNIMVGDVLIYHKGNYSPTTNLLWIKLYIIHSNGCK